MKAENDLQRLPYVWAVLRILIGLMLLWAFADKMFGLGFSTCKILDPNTGKATVSLYCQQAAIHGGSPTSGFLSHAATGPFHQVFNSMSGNRVVDGLFMSGLLLIGLALVLGIGIKVATATGSLLFFMMWLALFPGENNPLIDYHIVYIVVLMGILWSNQQQVWGLGKWWQSLKFVQKNHWLI